MELTVVSYNTLFAGRDGSDTRRADAQLRVIADIRPDIFLMQEASGFDADGGALLYALEQKTGMSGFLAVAPRTGQNVAIFIRSPLRPVVFEPDSVNFHHALARLTVTLPDDGPTLIVTSAHLCPNGAPVRQREASYLAVHAVADRLSLLAGDFNSVSPHDGEPEGFDALPAHHRARYLSDDLETADRSVIGRLEAAGWVDIGHQSGSAETTVPTPAYLDAEFAPMRCDYFMASAALARQVRDYRVIRTPDTDIASDHYPIVATFEVNS